MVWQEILGTWVDVRQQATFSTKLLKSPSFLNYFPYTPRCKVEYTENSSGKTKTIYQYTNFWCLAMKQCRQHNRCISRGSLSVPTSRALLCCLLWSEVAIYDPKQPHLWLLAPFPYLQYRCHPRIHATQPGTTGPGHWLPHSPTTQLRWLCFPAIPCEKE